MHLKRVIPCLDVDGGRVVKGTRFLELRDAGDPVELAAYYDREGADELVFLDITATSSKRETVVDLARRVGDEVFIPFTIGGGIRSVTDAQGVLDAGADKVSVNSAAVARPELISELGDVFGAQCVVLAIDAKRRPDRSWEVVVAGGGAPTGGGAGEWGRGGGEGGRARGGGDPADEHGPRRHQRRLRPRADRRRGRRRRRPGHRVGRRGRGPAPRRGAARRSRRRPGRLDLPLRALLGRRGQGAPRRRRAAGPPHRGGHAVIAAVPGQGPCAALAIAGRPVEHAVNRRGARPALLRDPYGGLIFRNRLFVSFVVRTAKSGDRA